MQVLSDSSPLHGHNPAFTWPTCPDRDKVRYWTQHWAISGSIGRHLMHGAPHNVSLWTAPDGVYATSHSQSWLANVTIGEKSSRYSQYIRSAEYFNMNTCKVFWIGVCVEASGWNWRLDGDWGYNLMIITNYHW